MKKIFVIYDGRATDNTDEATVMENCDSLKEAIQNASDYGEGCCIWSYDMKPHKPYPIAINETFEGSVWKGKFSPSR